MSDVQAAQPAPASEQIGDSAIQHQHFFVIVRKQRRGRIFELWLGLCGEFVDRPLVYCLRAFHFL